MIIKVQNPLKKVKSHFCSVLHHVRYIMNMVHCVFIIFITSWDTWCCPGNTHRCSHRMGCKGLDPTNFWEHVSTHVSRVTRRMCIGLLFFILARWPINFLAPPCSHGAKIDYLICLKPSQGIVGVKNDEHLDQGQLEARRVHTFDGGDSDSLAVAV